MEQLQHQNEDGRLFQEPVRVENVKQVDTKVKQQLPNMDVNIAVKAKDLLVETASAKFAPAENIKIKTKNLLQRARPAPLVKVLPAQPPRVRHVVPANTKTKTQQRMLPVQNVN